MPDYQITAPDGTKYKVTAPDGASQDDVMAFVQSQHSSAQAPDTRKTSQSLGAEEGVTHVIDRAASGISAVLRNPSYGKTPYAIPGLGDVIDLAGSKLGLPSVEQAKVSHETYFKGREKTEKPGGIGRFGGEVLATAPLAELGPVVGGAVAGGLAGSGQTPGEVTEDAATGAIGGKIAHAATGALGKIASPYLRKAGEKASDYIARLAKGAGKTVEDIEKYGKSVFDKPVTGAEALGRPGKAALMALGRREGETPDALEGFLQSRKLGAADRLLGDFSETVGINPEVAQGDLDELVKKGRQEATPLYDLALNAAPVITDRLQQFANEDIVQQGMRRGIKIERLKALAQGKQFDPNAYAITSFNEAGDPVIGPVPTWRSWDAAKTGLDDVLEQYRDPRTGKLLLDKMGNAINDVRASMLNELDGVNPAYKAARARAGDYLSAHSAFERGQKALLNGNVTERQFSEMLGKMATTDHEALKGGIANQLFNMAQTGKLKPSLLLTPRVQAKLIMAFGKDGAEQFTERLKTEAQISADTSRMMPGTGSQTSEVLNATTDQDVTNAALLDLAHATVHASTGNHHAAASRVGSALRTLYARGKTAGMSVEVRNEVGKLLMLSPKELAEHIRQRPQDIEQITKLISAAQATTGHVGSVGLTEAAAP